MLAFGGLPDGEVASGRDGAGRGIYVLNLATRETTPFDFALRAEFSPDGQWLLLHGRRGGAAKVRISGGTPVQFTDLRSPQFATNETVLGGGGDPAAVYRMPLEDGEPELVFAPDTTRGYLSVELAHPIGDGDQFLLNLTRQDERADVGIGSLKSGSYERILEDAHDAQYVRSGHLVFIQGAAQEGTLMAQPFDLARRRSNGAAVKVLTDEIDPRYFEISKDGLFVYRVGIAEPPDQRLYWYSVSGERLEELTVEPGEYDSPALSPNGKQVAFVRGRDDDKAIWVLDLDTGDAKPVTFSGAVNFPSWSPDGLYVLYHGAWGGTGLFRKRADGSGVEESLLGPEMRGSYFTMSPNGEYWVYTGEADGTGEIMLIPTNDSNSPITIEREFGQWEASVSPNGQYVAFFTFENGRPEIYVQELGGESFWPITQPPENDLRNVTWSADGRWLYYQTHGILKRSRITYEPGFSAARAEDIMLLSANEEWDLHPDGERILLIGGTSGPDLTYLDAIVNFDEYLRRIAPTNSQ
ncbi:MAG: dipeptidyl aminopeptidase/acylaminoacyl peptidase [Rhodothermales bacterium]|jgi:dipeptidyl aminopeptidase/acylaminoacyl peptidase